MTWEAITALASMVSSAAVIVAVLVAVRQVRVGAAQVEHLRKATQLEGTMKVFALLGSPEQVAGTRFIRFELAERMRDPAFRAEVENLGRMPTTPEHLELRVMSLMEMVGTYVKHDLLDAEIVFDYWHAAVTNTWERLETLGVIAAHRAATGPRMWENFEDLYVRAQRWLSSPERRPAAHRPRPPAPAQGEVVAGAPPD